ncbi:hypothetical protein A2U01_0077491, partial [Trifolium medium]|nr:hypothetical protein [Trifolium medium]
WCWVLLLFCLFGNAVVLGFGVVMG